MRKPRLNAIHRQSHRQAATLDSAQKECWFGYADGDGLKDNNHFSIGFTAV